MGFFGEGKDPIHLDNVECNGTEIRLVDCKRLPKNHNCAHKEDSGVRCQGKMLLSHKH